MIAHDAEDCECCEVARELVADLDEANIVIERGAVELRKAQKRIEELEHQLGNLRSQWPQILKDGQRYINEANQEFAKRKTAESRIEELEAQVARHPEQLRRVAEALERGRSHMPPTSAGALAISDALAIITEALK